MATIRMTHPTYGSRTVAERQVQTYLRVGWWWTISLMVITPVLLSVMAAINVYQEVTTRYEDYPLSGLLVLGWGPVLVTLVLAFGLQARRRHEPLPDSIGD